MGPALADEKPARMWHKPRWARLEPSLIPAPTGHMHQAAAASLQGQEAPGMLLPCLSGFLPAPAPEAISRLKAELHQHPSAFLQLIKPFRNGWKDIQPLQTHFFL